MLFKDPDPLIIDISSRITSTSLGPNSTSRSWQISGSNMPAISDGDVSHSKGAQSSLRAPTSNGERSTTRLAAGGLISSADRQCGGRGQMTQEQFLQRS